MAAGTVVVMVEVMAEAMAEATVVVMAEAMAEATVVVMAEATVVAMAVAMAAETNRSYQKKTPPFPLTCDEFSANASTIRTLPESFMM
jgi:hypothetical protein